MARRRLPRDNYPSDGGVPTPRAHRSRLATAAAALLLAAALTAYAAATTHSVPALVALIGAFGILGVAAGMHGVWEDGLAFGPLLLLVAYTISVTAGHQPVGRSAPLVAATLLALIDLGSWSLELRDGAEERPFAHLRTLVLLIVSALAVSFVLLVVGSTTGGGGIGLWILGAAAGLGLFTMLSGRQEGASLLEPNSSERDGETRSTSTPTNVVVHGASFTNRDPEAL